MEELKRTPLFREHQELKALIAPFGGWNMPIQYEGIIAEHRWCREKAALFDICHMSWCTTARRNGPPGAEFP